MFTDFLLGALPAFAVGLLFAGPMVWIGRKIGQSPAADLNGQTGRITLNRKMLAFAIGCAALFPIASLGFWVGYAVAPDFDMLMAAGIFTVLGVCGLAGIILMLPSYKGEGDIIWTDTGLTGPGDGLGLSRRTLSWAELTEFRRRDNGVMFVKNAANRRVVWSQYYDGYPTLHEALRHHRPDLDVPEH